MEVWTVFLLRHALSRISLTLRLFTLSIRSLIESDNLRCLTHSVLYPLRLKTKAILKYISGRTSYLRVR